MEINLGKAEQLVRVRGEFALIFCGICNPQPRARAPKRQNGMRQGRRAGRGQRQRAGQGKQP